MDLTKWRESRESVCVCKVLYIYLGIIFTVKNVLFLFGEEKMGLNSK